MSESVSIVNGSGEFLERVDVVLPIYSITKSYIAACVFAAQINIDERISAWIDNRLVPRGDEISVRQLLNHTSGIRDYGALPEYHEAIRSGRVWTDEQFADVTLHAELLFKPGNQWSYSNPGYWLLSKIIQTQCNLSFAE
ncbi:MAG: serine hydrolase [Gammaproteobacteria bacterium]|nr:serine hydrolase [Gammaproteobacteria bacterium]